MALKAIILDFDGVILESSAIKDRAFKFVYRQYPKQLRKIMAYHCSHPSTIRFKKFEYIAKNILREKYTQSQEKKLSRDFAGFLYRQIITCPFVAGAKDFLSFFHGRIPLYVASINPPRELGKIMKARRLKKYFQKVYCHPWSKKDAIKDILRREKISSKEAIFIGDSLGDYRAAKATRVFFIGRGKAAFNGFKIPVFKSLSGIREFFLSEGFSFGRAAYR